MTSASPPWPVTRPRAWGSCACSDGARTEGQRRGHRRPQTPTRPLGARRRGRGSGSGWYSQTGGLSGRTSWGVASGDGCGQTPQAGQDTPSGGGEERSWGPVLTLELGSLREKAAVLGLSQKDSPGRGTAKAEALSPSAFIRIWGEPCLAWGWGWSPPTKPPLAPHSRDSGTPPKVTFARSPIPLLMGTAAEKPRAAPSFGRHGGTGCVSLGAGRSENVRVQKGLDVVGAGAQGRAVGGVQKEPGGSPAQQVGAIS